MRRESCNKEAARNEFGALEREWYATTAKCAAIEGAVADLEARLAIGKLGGWSPLFVCSF
jgi:hypothetical protein